MSDNVHNIIYYNGKVDKNLISEFNNFFKEKATNGEQKYYLLFSENNTN